MKRNYSFYLKNAPGRVFGVVKIPGIAIKKIENYNEIVRIQTFGYKLWIYMDGGVIYKPTMSICDIMWQLDPLKFCLCHQSHIISGKYLKDYLITDEGLFAVMSDNKHIPVAVREEENFFDFASRYIPLRFKR